MAARNKLEYIPEWEIGKPLPKGAKPLKQVAKETGKSYTVLRKHIAYGVIQAVYVDGRVWLLKPEQAALEVKRGSLTPEQRARWNKGAA